MRRIFVLLACLCCGCFTPPGEGVPDASTAIGVAVWDDAWRSFTAKQTISMGPTCAQRPSQWTVNLDTREVVYSGCFFNRTMTGTHLLSPSQFETLRTRLRALVTSSNTSCVFDATDFELRVETPSGERVLESAIGGCPSDGTRVEGIEDVFQTLRSIVRQPAWNASATSFTASSHVVFGGPFCPGGNSDSSWSVDLVTGAFTFDSCAGTRSTGSRTLSMTELAQLRTALDGMWPSARSVCGADKHELLIRVPSTGQLLADEFYACRTDWNATFVEGIDPVFDALRSLSHDAPAEDGGVDAGIYPTGPAWPSAAERVQVDHFRSFLGPFSDCQFPDGGSTNRSTWSLDLDSGVIDYAVCYAQENLYVVDSGVLTPTQLAAFNAAVNTLEYVPWMPPPCSNDGDIDRFTIATSSGPLILNQSGDYCPSQPIGFRVRSSQLPRNVLEAATHP